MKNKQLERQAYLDGQLSVEEVIQFETDLSDREKAELEAERHFETILGERLSEGPACPDPLWSRLKTQMLSECQPAKTQVIAPVASAAVPVPTPVARSWVEWRTLSLAAMVLINIALLAVLLPKRQASVPPAVPKAFVFTRDLKLFAQDAEIPGDYGKIRSGLTEQGIHLSLAVPAETPHAIQPLGMCACGKAGCNCGMVRMYFACCGEPMLVIIAPRDMKVPLDQLPRAGWDQFRVASKIVDNYQIIVAGPHAPEEILKLFS